MIVEPRGPPEFDRYIGEPSKVPPSPMLAVPPVTPTVE